MDGSLTIQHALYSDNWAYDRTKIENLIANAQVVLPSEYTPQMKGHIFCPECKCPLFRSPEDKERDSAGRLAHFAHIRSIRENCSLRVGKAVGFNYKNEEEARAAVNNGDFCVIHSFLQAAPVVGDLNHPKKFKGKNIEDPFGPEIELAIGRHRGENFKVPSKIKTIRGLCKNFDLNLYSYYVLPGMKNPDLLIKIIRNIKTATQPSNSSGLYFGKVIRSFKAGNKANSIRMIELEYQKNAEYKDFFLKIPDDQAKSHGIDDDSNDHYILFFGKLEVSGVGLCINKPGWGEYAILPQKYERLLIGL